VTVDYPRLPKDQGKLQVKVLELPKISKEVLCKPSTSSLFDARSASSLCSFLPEIVDYKIAIIRKHHNHDIDQHVDPHTDQDADQESA